MREKENHICVVRRELRGHRGQPGRSLKIPRRNEPKKRPRRLSTRFAAPMRGQGTISSDRYRVPDLWGASRTNPTIIQFS